MKRKLKSSLGPEIPQAVGIQLTAEQIDEISQTLYSRFYHQFGMPDWKSLFNKDNRAFLTKVVKQVVDSMAITDYHVFKVKNEKL